jgi:hypothetical protein
MINDTIPANPILILKPEPNTVVFCADGEPYLTIGPDDVPPDVIERFQSWVKNNTPPVTPTVPKHLVDALIDATNKLREATLFDEANHWYDKQGEALAAILEGEDE